MATRKYQIQQKLENEMLTLHPETDADVVNYSDNKSLNVNNVQDAIDKLSDRIEEISINAGTVSGVKGEAESEYRVGNVSISKANIGLDKVNNVSITESQVNQIGTNQSNIQNLTNRIETNEENINTAQETANNAKLIAEGRAKAVSFNTISEMETALKQANVTDYKIGDNIFIKQTNVPDYWVSNILNNNSGSYGYFELSILETQKVDLDDYQKKSITPINVNNVSKATVEEALQAINNETAKNKTDIDNIKNGTTSVGDSNKLNGRNSAYYLDYNNFTNTPTLEIEAIGSGNFVKDVTVSNNKITKTLKNIENSDLPNSGVTAGAYSVVSVNQKGIVTGGGQLVEVGTSGQSQPSSSLAVGGLFFKLI